MYVDKNTTQWVVCVGNFMAIWVVFLSVPFYETLSLD